MRLCLVPKCIALVALLAWSANDSSAEPPPSEVNPQIGWIYRDKLRLGWTPDRYDQYQVMVDAGMNAVMPRLELDVPMDDQPHPIEQALSPNDAQVMSDLKRGSALAKKLGLHYFHCLNLAAEPQTYEGGTRNNAARYNDGKLPSPIDPVYWKRTITDRAERALKLLADDKTYAVDAIIIDPEMYALSGGLPGDPDYGKFAFETFLHEQNLTAPADLTDVSSRKNWLATQQLDQKYVRWQFDRIKQMGEAFRDLVHRYRPNAIVGYVIYENRMWFNAIAAGLTAPGLPVFVGPESTYSGVMDDRMVDYMQQMRKSIGVSCLLVPGVDMELENDQAPSARLTVLPGNIYQRCQHAPGYWVFAIYRMGNDQQQKPFFDALKQVNDALDQQARTGKVVSSLKAAPLPINLPKGFAKLLQDAARLKPVPPGTSSARFPYQAPMLRGTYTLLLWPNPGERQSITLHPMKLGNYLDNGNVQLFSNAGEQLQGDSIPLDTSRVFWIPESAGVPSAVIMTAGMNHWTLDEFSGRVLIAPEDMLTLNAGSLQPGRFYFYVPKDRKDFGISVMGDPGQPGNYTLFDPSGNKYRSWENVKALKTEKVEAAQPGIWCMEIGHLVNDGGFKLTDLPNLFALRPQDVMVEAR